MEDIKEKVPHEEERNTVLKALVSIKNVHAQLGEKFNNLASQRIQSLTKVEGEIWTLKA